MSDHAQLARKFIVSWSRGTVVDADLRDEFINDMADLIDSAVAVVEIERDSLRQQLAVTRAALAQCATALEGLLSYLIDPCKGGDDAIVMFKRTQAARKLLTETCVEHAVRVEAAREAVIDDMRSLVAWATDKNTENIFGRMRDELIAIRTKIIALDALTSERKS